MFGVALTTASCLRARTRVDVVWLVDGHGLGTFDPADAMALTPGGGRFGSLLGGALAGHLADLATRTSSQVRLVDLEVAEVDAAIAGLSGPGRVTAVVAPADQLPESLWRLLLERTAVCLIGNIDNGAIGPFSIYLGDEIDAAGSDVADRFRRGISGTVVESHEGAHRLVTILIPVDRFVIAGQGPIADALSAAAVLQGWQVLRAADVDTATGLMVDLTPADMVVVMGHDVELSSRMLAGALASNAGYIGALGSSRMQEQRANWLAYRGITDVDRVNGPAGLAIGAATPAEIAVSILAQVIAVRNL
ncbi:MAG: XdhC family protein [Ilumatobacteraceae bacterium]